MLLVPRKRFSKPMMPSFVADSMLGRLARWLRVMGYDTLYNPNFDDDSFLEAVSLGRIGLTRDKALWGRCGERCILIKCCSIKCQVAQLYRTGVITPRIDLGRTRCPFCNSPLERRVGNDLEGLLPRGVAELYRVFFMCSGCGKVFWLGSHFRRMVLLLEGVRNEAYTRVRPGGGKVPG